MAIVMIMEWPDVDLAGYEGVKDVTNFENDIPPGGMFHVAALDGTTVRVIDVWESAELFQSFVENKLMPATKDLGISSQPVVKILPAHSIVAPAYQ